MNSLWRRYLIAIATITWLMVVIGFYYISHKPFLPSQAFIVARVIGHTLVAVIVISVSGGLGSRLLPEMEFSPLAKLALQAALGLGILSIVILSSGSLIGINLYLAWACLIVLGLIMGRDIAHWWRAWGDILVIWRESGRFGKAIAIGIGVIAVSTLFVSLAPPLKFDALVYHLTLPRIYFESGRVGYVSDIMFWGMPQLGEMLYTWVFALAGLEAATVLGWMAGMIAIVGLVGFMKQRFGMNAAWVAAASLLSGYTLAASLSWGYVEWFGILYGLCVVVVLDLWRKKEGTIYLIIAGIYTGLTLGVKYTGGVLAFAGLFLILFQLARNSDNRSRIIKSLMAYVLPLILFSLPWWIKNTLATRNPLYPFFIPAGGMDRLRLELYQLPPWGDWLDSLLLPWQTTIYGIEGAPGFSASIGPLLLVLVPLSLLGWSNRTSEQRTTLSTASIISLVGLAVWVIASRLSGFLIQSRLYFSIFPSLAILAGTGFDSLSRLELSGIRLGRVVGTIILFVFGLSVVEVGMTTLAQDVPRTLSGLQTNEDYINDNLGWYGPAMNAIGELPEDAEVLMLWEPRSLYCTPKCSPDEVLDRWLYDLRELGDPLTVRQSWLEAGYTHLLYHRSGADFVREEDERYDPSDWEALDWLLDQLPPPTDFGGAYYLYTIEP